MSTAFLARISVFAFVIALAISGLDGASAAVKCPAGSGLNGNRCVYDRTPVGSAVGCARGQVQRGGECYKAPPAGFDWTTPGGLMIGRSCPKSSPPGTNDNGTTCLFTRSPIGAAGASCAAGQVQRATDCYSTPPAGWDWTTPAGLLIGRVCPADTADTGATCHYDRGVGTLPYGACPDGYAPTSDVDPLCHRALQTIRKFREAGTGFAQCNDNEQRECLGAQPGGNCLGVVRCWRDCPPGWGFDNVSLCVLSPDVKPRPKDCGNKDLIGGLCYTHPLDGFGCNATSCDMDKQVRPGGRIGTVTLSCAGGQDNVAGICYPAAPANFSCTVATCTFNKEVRAGGRLGVAQGGCSNSQENIAGLCYPKPAAPFKCAGLNCSADVKELTGVTAPTGVHGVGNSIGHGSGSHADKAALPKSCQEASDQYRIIAYVGFGSAPKNVQAWWAANKCTTTPAGFPKTCQEASNLYDMAPGKPTRASTEVQHWFKAIQCKTVPAAKAPVATAADSSALHGCVTRRVDGHYAGTSWMAKAVCQPNEIAVSGNGFCSGAGKMIGASTTRDTTDQRVWLWCNKPGPAIWYGMCCQATSAAHAPPAKELGSCTTRRLDAAFSGKGWQDKAVCHANELAISGNGSCEKAGQMIGASTTVGKLDGRAWIWCSKPGPATWNAVCCQSAAPAPTSLRSCVTRTLSAGYAGTGGMGKLVCHANEIAISGNGFCSQAGQMVGASTTQQTVDRNVWLSCSKPGNAVWYASCCQH